jgi:hypothetical protein
MSVVRGALLSRRQSTLEANLRADDEDSADGAVAPFTRRVTRDTYRGYETVL